MDNLLKLLILLASLLFTFSSCLGVGLFIWKKLLGKKLPETSVIFFLGEVFISLVTIISGLLFSYPTNLIFLLAFLFPFFVSGIIFFLKRLRTYNFPKDLLSRILLLTLTTLLAIYILRALLPPIVWDEVVYHEPVVREIAQGNVDFPLLEGSPYNNFYEPFSLFYGNFPYSSEAFASLGYLLSFGYPSIASILYLVNFAVFLFFGRWALKNLFRVGGIAWIAIGIALSLSGNLIPVLSTSYIDLNQAIYQFMAVILLLVANKKKIYYLIIPSLVFASYSLGQKYTATYFLPFYGLLFLIEGLREKSFKKFSPFLLKSILLGLLAGGFWYFKNLFLYGNPIYPLIFGHQGFSEKAYNLVTQTQLDPHFPRTLEVLWQQLKENYTNETGIIFSGAATFLFGILGKKKLNIYSIYLLIFSIYLFLFNFYVGNQLVRYILVAPIFIYFVLGQFLGKNKLLGVFLVLVVLLSFPKSPLWPAWKNKINDLRYLSAGNYNEFYKSNIGCLIDVVSLVQKNPKSKAINLWDPYASAFFSEEDVFYYPGDFGKNTSLPEEVEYLYINISYKEQFLINKDKNSNMLDIDGRLELEKALLNSKKEVFNKQSCRVYSVR